jgi:hypothetical protein
MSAWLLALALCAAAAPAKPSAPVLHVKVPDDGKDWQPLPVKAGGIPKQVQSQAILRSVKSSGKLKGENSPARGRVALNSDKGGTWIVAGIFPEALSKSRAHFEVRLWVRKGVVENAQAALVRVMDRRPGGGEGLLAFELRDRAIDFSEETPSGGLVVISALDDRRSPKTFNAGTLSGASFASLDVGLAEVSWSVRGLNSP